MEGLDLNYCKLCLVTDVKMFSMNTPPILEAYSQVVQIVVCAGYQMYACYECVSLLHKYQQFRLKCMTALNVLSSIHMDHSKITKEVVHNIDRNQFNLQSKFECSSILVCNSNDLVLLPSGSYNTDLLKNAIDSGKIIESDIPEIKLKVDVCDTNDIQDVITLSDSNDSNEIQDRNENVSNEIFLLSNHFEPDIDTNDYVPEIKMKRKRIPKLKKSKENADEPVAKRSRQAKGKEKKLSRRKKLYEDCIKCFKDYATVVLLTPEDARNEMLLRKKSRNYMSNPYKCDLCYKGFEHQLTYDNHMKKHSPENGNWECEYCHIRFSEKKFLYGHTGECHKKKFICKLCPYVARAWAQATAHMNLHKGKKYECRECGQLFRMPNTLSNHKRVKHPTTIVCALCGSTFAVLQGLHSHQRMSHRQEDIELAGPKCAECDVQFATETAWKRHLVLSSKHTVLNGCEECGEILPSREELQLHSRRHKKNRSYYHFKPPAACKICNKWLTSNTEYKNHMSSEHPKRFDATKRIQKQEAKEMQFVCETCGIVFKQQANFQDHRYTHTNERPYECRDCGRRFNYRSSLYIHKRSHTMEKPEPVFQCDICKKRYYAKHTLTKHIKVHLGIRPYKCSLCQKCFPHKYEMRTHINYVHWKQPWPKRNRTKTKAK